MPSLTHMALVALERAGILKFVISQNVDGLHLRSGISRKKLAELHGNSFMEVCPSCGIEYMRDFEVETIGLKETSRRCSDKKCGARLKDTVLDWEDALPSKEMNQAEKHCRMADVVLCLGTSLQITPACNLPLRSLRGGGKIVIVNLQKTPKDKKATLLLHGLVDKVISGVLDSLNLQIPPFVRIDLFQIILTQALSIDEKYVNWNLRVASVHGLKAPLPFIKSIEISFVDNQDYKAAILQNEPFQLKRRTSQSKSIEMVLKFNFIDGCGCPFTEINVSLNWEVSTDHSKLDKDAILQKLRDTATDESCCGKNAVVERNFIPSPKTEVLTYAIVTNVVTYKTTAEAVQADTLSNGVKRRKSDGPATSKKRSKVQRRKSRL
ncbi:NAD-dependent protein deacetylase SRT1 isoform X2 [Rosa chinensis]|nr:NAD-dependent protein deacetylase SRT1 isoform X2 [Rosa chinensis]